MRAAAGAMLELDCNKNVQTHKINVFTSDQESVSLAQIRDLLIEYIDKTQHSIE